LIDVLALIASHLQAAFTLKASFMQFKCIHGEQTERECIKSAYKNDVILWIVSVSSTYVKPIPLHLLDHSDVIATVEKLQKKQSCARHKVTFMLHFNNKTQNYCLYDVITICWLVALHA